MPLRFCADTAARDTKKTPISYAEQANGPIRELYRHKTDKLVTEEIDILNHLIETAMLLGRTGVRRQLVTFDNYLTRYVYERVNAILLSGGFEVTVTDRMEGGVIYVVKWHRQWEERNASR